MGVYITEADITAAMSTDDKARLFDRNGNGNAGEVTSFVNLAIAYGESRINGVLNGRFPVPLPAPIDLFVKQINLDAACAFGARYHAAYQGNEKSPYAVQWKEGLADLRAMVRDADLRPVTSPAGLAQPVATMVNPQTTMGFPTDPLTRVANLEDPSDF